MSKILEAVARFNKNDEGYELIQKHDDGKWVLYDGKSWCDIFGDPEIMPDGQMRILVAVAPTKGVVGGIDREEGK